MCEWGSGFGVVASLASMLEYNVCGIEIERDLVDASRRLADDFGLPVEFVHGSFIPAGAEAFADEILADNGADFICTVTDADDAYDRLGLDPDDFDVFFVYPWPGEEGLIESLFEKYAADGALLLLYGQFDSVRLRRKVRKKSGRR
jgi:protein-L-isoaspartate O-methyltransferase